jgi:hypothetical protein
MKLLARFPQARAHREGEREIFSVCALQGDADFGD